MSKNLTKAQIKRQKLREETEILNGKRKKLNDCEDVDDHLSILPMFKKFTKGGLELTIKSLKHAPSELESWIFESVKENMQSFYENGNGWSDEIKSDELFEDRSRYIIAFDGEKPVGFVHFRFELDTPDFLVYIYEIHINKEYRLKGIGKFMMQAIEFVGLKRGAEYVMVTLFKENLNGVGFFSSLHYVPHPSSPEMIDPEEAINSFYQIFYKSLVKKN